MQEKRTYTYKTPEGDIECIFSDFANQTSQSVVVKQGDTSILVTVVVGSKKETDYFPLTVEFEERFYAVGRILGGRYIRREGRPSTQAILKGRMIDRTIRPLFDTRIRNEVQVVITVLSLGDAAPEALGVIGASLALHSSPIPWNGPVSALYMVKENKEWKTTTHTPSSDDFIFVCTKRDTVTMMEMSGRETKEDEVVQALTEALKETQKIEVFQETTKKVEGQEKQEFSLVKTPDEVRALLEEKGTIIKKYIFSGKEGREGKKEVEEALRIWRETAESTLDEKNQAFIEQCFEEYVDALVHDEALRNEKRADGRGFDEVRGLYAEIPSIAPRAHGSGMFYRGGTHVLSVLTLGGGEDTLLENSIDDPEGNNTFFYHYNFPPYSVEETGRIGFTNRRTVGHGALAEKALKNVLPEHSSFPYTIRLVSECVASNGSSSMASVCAGTLALMDGGVPIRASVAGVAMGLIMGEKGEYKVLTDIQGVEDHYGDMDLKVAGTKNGITAMQMDVKVSGVSKTVLTDALTKARDARLHILQKMDEAIHEPREEVSPRAPLIIEIKIPTDYIGKIIGPGGSVIKGIREDTGITGITVNDDGKVSLSGGKEGVEKARGIIENIVKVYAPGEEVDAVVTSITEYGAFASLDDSKNEGLIHISEFSPQRIESAGDVLSVGETVPVVVKEIKENGKISLSIKDRDPDFITKRISKNPSNNSRTHEKQRQKSPQRRWNKRGRQ